MGEYIQKIEKKILANVDNVDNVDILKGWQNYLHTTIFC